MAHVLRRGLAPHHTMLALNKEGKPMLWMETLMIAGLALAMAAVLGLIVAPLGDMAAFSWEDDSLDLPNNAWPFDHNV